MSKQHPFHELIIQEGWEVHKKSRLEEPVIVVGERVFPYNHPFAVHAILYREGVTVGERFLHLKAMHDYAWPHYIESWNYWDERRFLAFCGDYDYVSYAGGAHSAKSHCAARLAMLFWMAAPHKRTVTVASTTIEAASTRIWGYISRFSSELQFKFSYHHYGGNSPKMLYDRKDPVHGMYAVAAGRGTDEKAISNWIGKHPKEAHLIILDEATDLNPAILKGMANLDSGSITFKCVVIGNSSSKFDLHGAMSTPKNGWESINPMQDVQWETTQKNGLCLFFNCYESPAIFEADEKKRLVLEKIFITSSQIKEKEKLYGKDSDSFWRFVVGFWRTDGAEDTIISQLFVSDFDVFKKAEWLGIHPLQVVAGLDPAFSSGGDQCILRLALLGQQTDGRIVLDFRDEELLFRIPIMAHGTKSVELQIADRVIEVLKQHNCSIGHLCIDANGAGRALGEVIRLRAGTVLSPIKVFSTRTLKDSKKDFDIISKGSHELWFQFRDFIQNRQIKGLDRVTVFQLTSRKVLLKNGRQELEKKRDYKNRLGAIMPSLARSPDEADAASLALLSAVMHFGFTPGQVRAIYNEENTFQHMKQWTFDKMVKLEENHSRSSPPVATFDTSVEDMNFASVPWIENS